MNEVQLADGRTSEAGQSDYVAFRLRLDEALTADLIATQAPLTMAESTQQVEVRAQMDKLGFDVLPVDAAYKEFWVLPRALPRLGSRRRDPVRMRLQATDLVAADTPALAVLRLMVDHQRRFYFVLRGADISGLVTYGDLDKRPVRTAVFALVNALEQALLGEVLRAHGSDEAWKRYLNTSSVDRIMKYWRRARVRDLELNPLHYGSLTDLVAIAKASSRIRPLLDRAIGPEWHDEMINLRDFARDPVSHPGKPLVDSPSKVPALWRACQFGERALAVISGGVTPADSNPQNSFTSS